MSIMKKILALFKLSDTIPSTPSNHTVVPYTPMPQMEQYHKRKAEQKKNNLNITYQDISMYDRKPFDLNYPLISDGNFICIALANNNLDLAYHYLHVANTLLKPFHKYYQNSVLPNNLHTDYVLGNKLPTSHLRLTPYTATMRKCKYPFYLWLQDFTTYGYVFLYRLYFNQKGEWTKGDLTFHGDHYTTYQIQIRNDGTENYVRRIDRTLYKEPYGTEILYIDERKPIK